MNVGQWSWEFLSIERLEDPSKLYDLVDELQGLFWVLLWTVAHRFDFSDFVSVILEMFTEKHEAKIDGELSYVGGRMKKQFLLQHEIDQFVDSMECKSLAWLLTTMATHWGEYYHLKVMLAKAQIRGASNALCLAQAVPGVSQPASREQVETAHRFATKHKSVSDPKFWISILNKAISMDEWEQNALAVVSPASVNELDNEATDLMPAKKLCSISHQPPTEARPSGPSGHTGTDSEQSTSKPSRVLAANAEQKRTAEVLPGKRGYETDVQDEGDVLISSRKRKRARQASHSEPESEDSFGHHLPPPRTKRGNMPVERTESEQLVVDVANKLNLLHNKGSSLEAPKHALETVESSQESHSEPRVKRTLVVRQRDTS